MKIGLVGGSSVERALPFDAQRTVNLYPVFDQSGKQVAALYGTPGLSLFATGGGGPIRGVFCSANNRAFFVSGSGFYEVLSTGVSSLLGSLSKVTGNISIVENGIQLAICDGASVYILTYSTNVFAKVTDADLPIAKTIAFIDGYFIVNKASSGSFYISSLYDGSSWSALDFATAESSPDELLRVFNAVGQLWLFGTYTTEIWTNTGDNTFPFQRISGAKMEMGILSPHSTVAIDNSVFWVGRDTNGSGSVFRANGFSPKRISTSPIEMIINRATDKENIRAYTYQEDGHVFYVLTGGGLETSLVYDISTDIWHERAYLNSTGLFEQHLASSHMFAFGKHLVGDRNGGNIYEMSQSYYSDNGNPLVRERTFTHISDENKYTRYSSLEIDFELGVGLQSGQGVDPQAILTVSKDGAKTWSDEMYASIGRVGKFFNRARFRRLGISNVMTFRVRVSDPVKVAIIGAYLS